MSRALTLGGGGARGAYQAGALLAIHEIAGQAGIERPFGILSGLSAGALNVAYLASHHDRPVADLRSLTRIWSRIRTNRVFRTDVPSLTRIGLGWLIDLMFGGLKPGVGVKALLDTTPLARLLASLVRFDEIRSSISDGRLAGVVVTASSYASGSSVSFAQTGRPAGDAPRGGPRTVRPANLSVDHILASASIPLFFPPVQIGGEYFGDGALKNTAPLSGAVRLGASSLCVIGVHRTPRGSDAVGSPGTSPTAAKILGMLLGSLFMDSLDADVERLGHINRVIAGRTAGRRNHGQRHIELLYLLPSCDVAEIALRHWEAAPATLRYLVRGLGSDQEAADLLSYLLFEGPYCSALVDLGYRDTWDRKERVRAHLCAAAETAVPSS